MNAIEFWAIIKDGIIEVPAKYRDQIKNRVRVILVPEEEQIKNKTYIDQLLESPLLVPDFHPLKRDDIYEH